jgi:adenine-specific DNA-methyltransferase
MTYGLVWETHPDPRESLPDHAFRLAPVPTLNHGNAPWGNTIVEGDNYDALRVLRTTHAGKIRCIYIDPPYNTGARDFVYRDRYVDRDHAFKHSLWLDFMHRRLVLAKKLLAEDGVIFVSIGEDSYAPLSLLMERVFPEMKVGTFVWRTREGANDAKAPFFSHNHEYILCYARPGFSFRGLGKGDAAYDNPDNDPRGPWQKADLTKAATYKERPNTFYPICNPETGIWYPCNPNRVWAYASDTRLAPNQKTRSLTMEGIIREGRVIWPADQRSIVYATLSELLIAIRDGTAPPALKEDLPDLDFLVGKPLGFGTPTLKRFLNARKTDTRPLSSWIVATSASGEEYLPMDGRVEHLRAETGRAATQALNDIMGAHVFHFPKPLSLIQGLVAQATRPDRGDIILDFFAGSGTTAHAVLAQNAEDDGDRTFVLVSSRESTQDQPDKNLCRDVTRERVRRVMAGYEVRGKSGFKTVEGLGGGFAYLRAEVTP